MKAFQRYRHFTFVWRHFIRFAPSSFTLTIVLQPRRQCLRFGLLRFRSPLLSESLSLSFPVTTEMFHFVTCLPSFY